MSSLAKEIYRNLLKAVNKNIGKEEHKSHFVDYIKEEFKRNINSRTENLKLAHNYIFYLNSVHHHKDLLFSYNIAVDRSNEVKKVLGKSAASVGLRLPEVYAP
ncbi:hypothetical protein ACS0TY_019497 [Phlomoides rotata]